MHSIPQYDRPLSARTQQFSRPLTGNQRPLSAAPHRPFSGGREVYTPRSQSGTGAQTSRVRASTAPSRRPLSSYISGTPRTGAQPSPIRSIYPSPVAGEKTQPRLPSENLPKMESPLGRHSAMTVGESNQGRPGYQEYPSTKCKFCKRGVDKYKAYATAMLENTSNQCLVVFELAEDWHQMTADGSCADQGAALIKMITPINEKVTVGSHPHFFLRNPSYCIECIRKMPVYKIMLGEMQSIIRGHAHFALLPHAKPSKKAPKLRGPHYSRVKVKEETPKPPEVFRPHIHHSMYVTRYIGH